MKKIILLNILFLIWNVNLNAQTPIDVAENTLKVSAISEEIFYYGFAEGDQMIFSFEEMNGKELKEIEIIEWPTSSKFMDYKSKKVENKTITVTKTGIYKFRLYNSSLSGRVCKVKIQRIPANDLTKNFNCSVYWKTLYDTTYTPVEENYISKTDTIISNITDQVAKVHSAGNLNGNRTTFNFVLPKNTVAWAYYVGVDQTGKEAFDNANTQLTKLSPTVSKIPGYGPLAALAIHSISYFSKLTSGEDIDFYIVEGGNNANLFLAGQEFYYKKRGKIINDYSRMTNPLTGNLYFCLSNDNAVTGVNVIVKVTAIIVNNTWSTRTVMKMSVANRREPYLK